MLGDFIARLARAASAVAPGVLVGWSFTCVLLGLEAPRVPGLFSLVFCAATLAFIAWLALAVALVPLSALPERWLPGANAGLDRSGLISLAGQGALALVMFWPLRSLARPLIPTHLSYPDSIAFAASAYACAALACTLWWAYRVKRAVSYPFWTAGALFVAARVASRGATHLIAQGYEQVLDLLALAALIACCMQLGRFVQQKARSILAILALLASCSVALLVLLAGSKPVALADFAQTYRGEAQLLARMRAFIDLDGDGSSAWLGGDCDDDNPLVSPIAFEIVGNGIDDNCMGGDLPKVIERAPRRLDAGAPKHNIVLVTVDAVRADMLDAQHMPQLTRFAARAAVFEHAYAVAPFTSGSIPTLMTGHYLMNTGALWQHNMGQDESLADLLSQAGYATCAVVHPFWNVKESRWNGVEGFATVVHVEPERYIDTRAVTGAAVTERALAELARLNAGPAPFFMWIHYLDAHAEYVERPGTPFSEHDDARARYAQEVWATDQELGRLIAELERSHFLEDGVVVVHSDHGELIEDRGRTGHALWLDEDVIHALLLLYGPGAPSGRFEARVRLIDLFPTLLGYAGITAPSSGVSLMPVMTGEDTNDRDVFVYSFYAQTRQSATLSGRYKLHQDYVNGTQFLYDLHDDPRETVNLVARRPEIAGRLRELLGQTWDAELNDVVIQRRSAQMLRRMCSHGVARACAALGQ